jgi:hypothetical protein
VLFATDAYTASPPLLAHKTGPKPPCMLKKMWRWSLLYATVWSLLVPKHIIYKTGTVDGLIEDKYVNIKAWYVFFFPG